MNFCLKPLPRSIVMNITSLNTLSLAIVWILVFELSTCLSYMSWFQPDLWVLAEVNWGLALRSQNIILVLKIITTIESVKLFVRLVMDRIVLWSLSLLKVGDVNIQVLIWHLRKIIITTSVTWHSIGDTKSIISNQIPPKMHLSWLLGLNCRLNSLSIVWVDNFSIIFTHRCVRSLNHLRMDVPEIGDFLL